MLLRLAFSRKSGGYLPALFRATMAGFGAILAMLRFVPGAFITAGLANFRADAADARRKVGPARHEPDGGCADRRAGAIQLDAACHHLDVLSCSASETCSLVS